jgi:ABC-type multidrug transport system fused ATPase/permease subunit
MRIVIGLGRVALGLLMVWFSKMFIDVTIRTGTWQDIIWMICSLVVIVMGGVILRQVYYYMTVKANTYQSNLIRLRLFSQLFSTQLFEQQVLHSGDVTSRMSKDIEVVSTTTTSSLPEMVITGFQLLGAFLLLYSMDQTLAWTILLITPIAIIFGKFISNKLRLMTLKIRHDESRIQIQIQEGMELNAVLRSLNSEEWVTGRLDTMQNQLKDHLLHRAKFTSLMRFTFGSVFGLGYLLAFIWGGLQLRNGLITFGVMTSFLQLVGQIQQPILQLLNTFTQLMHATASIDRLQELESKASISPSFSNLTGTDDFTVLGLSSDHHLGIQVDDISFQYASGDRRILNHFSHDFKPCSKTAIMGATGIGKTTLFRLLLALIKPQDGHISLYNSKEKTSVSEKTRDYFVYVPQGNTLLSGTLRFNMQLAKPDATDEEIYEALHTAAADFVQELPEGIDTELGERGSGLSEGQAQRIAIARGLLRPGSILLLDEISASLDEQTELLLYKRLFARYPEKTMIFITHRTIVSQMCDEIIQLSA